ncbi:MAG: helix-turn-helix domain-containing protein [Acetatifactor sp.]|nr:helix-turn-helix domain-containing protein [Acetatifactor sp.]
MSNKVATNITLERIKELKGNDSQEVFAQKIHTTQSNISKMLKGMTPPSAAILTELAKTYHVSVDWLLGLSDEKETKPRGQSHKLTAETVTYADAMAVLEILYQKGSIDVGYDNNGYNSKPDPSIILVKDKVLAYFLDNRSRYSGGSQNIYEIWVKQAMEVYEKYLLLQWTDSVNAVYEQNVPKLLSDEAIASLVDDIANGRLEVVPTQSDGFI